jgi:hypothetical protein
MKYIFYVCVTESRRRKGANEFAKYFIPKIHYFE